MTDINIEIRNFLTEKLVEKVSTLVRYYFVELSDNEEAKKTIEAHQFMESLLTGKGLTKKDSTFIEKHQDLFDEIHTYSRKLRELEPKKDN